MFSRLSDSLQMTPWEVIEEALVHRRPRRTPQWLADQLKVSVQVVSNWKARGVPARRFREIAETLGITIDQLEGVEPLPWDVAPEERAGLLPEVAQVASAINSLPKKWRQWVLRQTREAIDVAKEAIALTSEQAESLTVSDSETVSPSAKRVSGA